MLFKPKKEVKAESKLILGMVILRDAIPLNLDLFQEDIKKNNKFKIGKAAGDMNATAFTIDGETVAIGSMSYPIPWGDIEGTAKYAYNWENAIQDIENHKGHLIVSIMHGTENQVKRYRIFTSVICSLLRTNNAIGVFKGNQSLLIPNDDYISEAARMSDDWYPLNLWIYFGMGKEQNKGFGYTYGLREFNKLELEISDSERGLDDIRMFLYNIIHYILDYNVEFKDGQTCGVSETERIRITLSAGRFVDSDSFKLAY
jgi:hypothetical protein